jgi:cation diffusion facilitator CzcD-associated flavoprotein CzcO
VRLARRHLERQVPDRAMRAKLTPDDAIGFTRILPSNRWSPTVTKPNVDVVTDGIASVRPDGIVDGALHPVDTIVFPPACTSPDMRMAMLRTGTGDRRLSDVSNGSPQA